MWKTVISGISADELRHGTFGRFRLVISIDSLDKELRSNRENVREGPLLKVTQYLRAIFNFVRPFIEAHDEAERLGQRLSSRVSHAGKSVYDDPSSRTGTYRGRGRG